MRRALLVLFLLSSLSVSASTYTVDDFGDTGDSNAGDDVCDTGSGVCTLRAAIEEANANLGADTIEFTVGGLISPATPLPPLTEQVTIDGTSASDYLGVPVVLLDGPESPSPGLHFDLGSDNSVLSALEISGFSAGVLVDADAVTIRLNYLGPVSLVTPNLVGLQLNGTGSTIGGADGEGNVISGNNGHGIAVSGANHDIRDNFIGVDPTGLLDLANGDDGINVIGSAVTIGGATAGEENVISGNWDTGVTIDGGTGTVVAGNYIGLDATGTAPVPNFIGVEVNWPGNTVGTAAARNVISGNDDDGIDINASNTIVHNNFIGPDATGLVGVGNFGFGIALLFVSDIDIGGSGAGEGNVISFNAAEGIFAIEADTSRITGNIIGLDAAGTSVLGNGLEGILLLDSFDVTVASNVVSGNSTEGIVDAGGLTNIFELNRVGTTADGSTAAGNLGTGIELFATIDTIVRENVVSANDGHGIETTFGAAGSLLYLNIVGLSADLATPMGNQLDGINVCDGSADTVVGSVALGGNIISANVENGIGVEPTALTGNTWAANSIYDNELLGIDIGIDGVTPNDDQDPDEGANNYQNFPELTLAVTTPASSQVLGTINSLPNTAMSFQLYSSPAADPSGFGEGRTYLGETGATTNANGDATFVFAGPALTLGDVVTATATTADGTSEFSAPVTVGEAPVIVFSSATYTIGEAGVSQLITVTRSGNLDAISTVAYTTSDDTATTGSDYTTASGTLTFVAGDDTETFVVPVTNDTTDEPDEIVDLTLSDPTAATLGAPSAAELTITDDDPEPAVSIDDDTESEGDTLTFTLTLTNPSVNDVTVNFTTADDTATAGVDYTGQTNTATILAGNLTTTINIATTADTTFEPDETFFVNLTGATNATIAADDQGLGTIANDDGQPTVSIDDDTESEGDTLTFTLTLTNPSASDVTVNFTTADDTATAGVDYTAQTNTATITAGNLTTTINLATTADTTFEPDETFFVNLTGATNATITDNQGLGTITNDDGQPTVSIDDDTESEGDTLTFTLTLTNPSASDVIVNFMTADDTATAGVDYTAQTNTATITAGNLTTTINIPTAVDAITEPDETFFVNLTGATNATITDDQGLGTITNDDGQPTVIIDDRTHVEGTSFTFTLTLSNLSASDVTVSYTTADDTATAGSDYAAQADDAVITAGTLSTTISVPTTDDAVFESDETFFVNLTGATNATIADNQGLGTLTDNDNIADLNITKTASNPSFTPGDPVTFTITVQNLGPAPATALTVTDVLPAGTTLVSATGPDATCSGTTTVTCTIPTLASGASTSITLIVNATAVTPIANTASVSAASPPDPTPLNNAATATVTPTGIDEVPTMTEWGLVLLALGLGLMALRKL